MFRDVAQKMHAGGFRCRGVSVDFGLNCFMYFYAFIMGSDSLGEGGG